MLSTAACLLVGGCGGSGQRPGAAGIPRSLLAQARPIGIGPRFHPGVSGPVGGPCDRKLGRRFEVHVEVFAADRVVLLPAGIGVREPVRMRDGRIVSARCFGAIVTLDPTGVVFVRAGDRVSLRDLFRAWGQPLGRHALVGFLTHPGGSVTVYVNGRESATAPGLIRMTPGSEIVLEIGPHVPPHRSYVFPAKP